MCVGFIDVIVADHLPSGNKKAISVNVKKHRGLAYWVFFQNNHNQRAPSHVCIAKCETNSGICELFSTVV
jgi:hypothetical protein